LAKKKVALGIHNVLFNSLQSKYPLFNTVFNPSVLIIPHNTNSIASIIVSVLGVKLGYSLGIISVIILFL